MRAFLLIPLGIVVSACVHGGMHRKGERMASVRVHAAPFPIEGSAIAWQGERDEEYFGAGVWTHKFTSDRIALGLGLSFHNYQFDGDNVKAAEIEGNYRHYLAEHGDTYAYFWEFYGGAQYAEAPVPSGATRYEFTFAFGPGMEIKLGEKPRLLAGVQFHHQSNALGRMSPRNPSQNDLRLWVAFGWMW